MHCSTKVPHCTFRYHPGCMGWLSVYNGNVFYSTHRARDFVVGGGEGRVNEYSYPIRLEVYCDKRGKEASLGAESESLCPVRLRVPWGSENTGIDWTYRPR